MAIRLLPFRDYDEHDVVNIYRMDGGKGDFIDLSDSSKRSTAKGDAGVFVKVKNGNLGGNAGDTWDPIDLSTSSQNSLLGKSDYPNVGRNVYPQAALTVEAIEPSAGSAQPVLGVTLRQTVEKDELGENLLYNPVKKDELFGVYPGEAVPVLSKGMVSLTDQAFDGAPSVGDALVPSPAGGTLGCVSGVAYGSVANKANVVGTVLASGARDDNSGGLGGTNVFGNPGYQSGAYYIVKLNCA